MNTPARQYLGRFRLAVACAAMLTLAVGCGDTDDAGSADNDAVSADGAEADGALSGSDVVGDAGAAGDGGARAADASDAGSSDGGAGDAPLGDAATGDATEGDGASGDGASGDGAGGDSLGSDAATADAGDGANSDTAGSGAGADGAGSQDPCGVCPVDKQPKGDHPGAKGSCTLLSPKEVAYGSGFGQGYKKMLVFRPTCAGGHPVLFFVHGKSLYETGGIVGKLGDAYKQLLTHVASHGYIAVFVRVEQGLLDGDHERMADDLLAATKKLYDTVSVASKTEVVFAGHSMGAKVALLATAKTWGKDSNDEWVNPRATLAFSVSNEKPPLGKFVNAVDALKSIPKTAELSVTYVQPHDDKVAVYNDPKKPNALALYEATPVAHKQLIVLHGTGKDDPNPPTSPELHDDHSAALTVVGKIGGVADFAMPVSYLDALDWYGFWKITVGAMNYHFKKGDKTWAYGDLRTHGGTLPNGKIVTHEVVKSQGP